MPPPEPAVVDASSSGAAPPEPAVPALPMFTDEECARALAAVAVDHRPKVLATCEAIRRALEAAGIAADTRRNPVSAAREAPLQLPLGNPAV